MQDNNANPVLIILEGEQIGQRWTIDGQEFVIGRGADCDLVLPERQVSREHVRIYREGEQYFLQDLDSKNGTWLNSDPVKNTTVRLEDGDEISIALAVRMTYVASESTAPLTGEVKPPSKGILRLDRDSRPRV
ncbi:MAG: FHA domain-containing protein, partial [Anaerolineae bacterium]|nr:FHA domain-containing protein [Anaerolineae bacterium]